MNDTYSLGNIIDSVNQGWLEIPIKQQGSIFLPYSTKVKLLKQGSENEEVEILEGNYKGLKATIPYLSKNKNSHYSYLVPILDFKKNKKLIVKDNRLYLNEESFEVVLDRTKLSPGVYTISFPVRIEKKIPKNYFDESAGGSRFADTWFPLLRKNDLFADKYLHYGTYSEGCLTVIHQPNSKLSIWSLIYTYLMTCRFENHIAFLEIY